MRNLVCASIFFALCTLSLAGEEKWKPAPSPLKTRFAEKVSTREVPLYEFYPRPLITRHHDGRNLSGLWDYAVTSVDVNQPPAEFQGKIMAPFPIEAALSGVRRNMVANEKLWYRISVELPWGTDWLKGQNSRMMLRFGGVSGTAMVFVNGKEIGCHQGSNDGFSFDVTETIVEKGKHQMQIVVSATPDGITGANAATGIFKPAWIETVRTSHIEGLKFTADVDGSNVRVTPSGPATDQDMVEVIAYDRNFEVARASGKMNDALTLKIDKLKLWSPEKPFTYEYRATVTRGKQVLDSVFSLFAVRKISLGKGENGVAPASVLAGRDAGATPAGTEAGPTVVLLNNKPVFLAGVLDAGWWPDGGATAPYYEALRRDIEKVKQLGFNTVRKALRTDQDQWYFWADRLGVMVLQDLPSGETKQLLQEYPRIIAELYSHPCIIAWVLPAGLNADAAKQLTVVIRESDPTRLIVGGPDGDVRERALGDVEKGGVSKQATILSPIGDVQAPLTGHTWSANAPAAAGDLTVSYMELATKVITWKAKAGLSGYVYRQLADAADDYSGLISSDRAAIKLDLEAVALTKPSCFAVPQLTSVVPSGRAGQSEWLFTEKQPQGDWNKPSFDASAWSKGSGPFGATLKVPANEPPAPMRLLSTNWTSADLWLRREFALDTARLYDPWIVLRRTGDATVFLNGNPVAERREASPNPEVLHCANGAVGRNVFAAHGHAEAGKGSLDVGLFDLLPQRDMRLPPGIKPIVDTWMRDTCIMLGPDGVYYMIGTGTTAPWKCDGIPLYKSTDLKNWELVKFIVWRDQFKDTWLLKDRKGNISIWAPELHYIKGNYYVTFCTDWAREGGVSGTGYLKSTTGKVEGPYALVNTDGPINPGHLDASFFQDDDGAVYFLDGGSSIARMKDDMSGLAEPIRRVGAEGGGTVGFEGISMFKRNGIYYLSVTDSKMPYKTYDCMVGMSKNVYGPYSRVHCAVPHGGHNVFFKDKEGNWWSTLFGGDTPEVSGALKEQPGIVRVEFAPDGTIHPLSEP
ncbi:MAG TPA: family 43 glycosylhydrolase [Planctomycetota bacterium]|jgi:hypothetical protein